MINLIGFEIVKSKKNTHFSPNVVKYSVTSVFFVIKCTDVNCSILSFSFYQSLKLNEYLILEIQ